MTIDRCLLTVEPKVFEPLARKYRPSEASNIKTLIQKKHYNFLDYNPKNHYNFLDYDKKWLTLHR